MMFLRPNVITRGARLPNGFLEFSACEQVRQLLAGRPLPPCIWRQKPVGPKWNDTLRHLFFAVPLTFR